MAALSGNITNYLAKAVGIGGLALVGYESHCVGKMQAVNTGKSIKADTLSKQYLENMRMDSPSVIRQEVKRQIFNFHAEEGFTDFFTNIAGYVKGFGSMLITNIVPLGLSAGAVMTKGFFSKMFGAGLLAYGGIFLAQEFFGIGKNHK